MPWYDICVMRCDTWDCWLINLSDVIGVVSDRVTSFAVSDRIFVM